MSDPSRILLNDCYVCDKERGPRARVGARRQDVVLGGRLQDLARVQCTYITDRIVNDRLEHFSG